MVNTATIAAFALLLSIGDPPPQVVTATTPHVSGVRERFLAEALTAWEQLESMCSGLVVTGAEATTTVPAKAEAGRPRSERSYTKVCLKTKPPSILVERHGLTVDGARKQGDDRVLVNGYDGFNAFDLVKHAGVNVFELSGFTPAAGPKHPDLWQGKNRKQRLVDPLYACFDGYALRDLLHKDGFHLGPVVQGVRDGRAVVVVSFEYHPEDPKDFIYRGGRLTLDPARLWSVVEAEIRRTHTDGRHSLYGYVFTAHDGPSGVPIIDRVVYSQELSGDAGGRIQTTTEVQGWEYRDIPHEEFAPSFYGVKLDEPPVVERRLDVLPLLLFGGGGLSAIAAVAVKARRRR